MIKQNLTPKDYLSESLGQLIVDLIFCFWGLLSKNDSLCFSIQKNFDPETTNNILSDAKSQEEPEKTGCCQRQRRKPRMKIRSKK